MVKSYAFLPLSHPPSPLAPPPLSSPISLHLSQSSAVKKRDTEVDEARIITWWHLITTLLPVCLPSLKIHVFSEVSKLLLIVSRLRSIEYISSIKEYKA